MIHCPPQIDHLTIQLDVHLVEMSFPLVEAAYPAHPTAANVQRTMGRTCSTTIAPSRGKGRIPLKPQVFDVPQRERKPDVQHHDFADQFGRGMEIPEEIIPLGSRFAAQPRDR